MSAPILFDQSRLKAYDGLMRLCEFAGKTGEWQQALWSELLTNQKLYDAFVYYLENHGLPDEPKCGAGRTPRVAIKRTWFSDPL